LLGVSIALWRDNKILLAERANEPAGLWALPGGLVDVGETLQQAAIRELHEETALVLHNLQFARFSEVIRRDEQNRIKAHFVLSIFVADRFSGIEVAGDDAASLNWAGLNELDEFPMPQGVNDSIRWLWDNHGPC
jgi:ADP-ribose pyrophosphatase YjhB (NUDIX family)